MYFSHSLPLLGAWGWLQASQDKELKRMLSVAVAIDELESTMPAWLLEKLKPSNYPAYVHVLRVRGFANWQSC